MEGGGAEVSDTGECSYCRRTHKGGPGGGRLQSREVDPEREAEYTRPVAHPAAAERPKCTHTLINGWCWNCQRQVAMPAEPKRPGEYDIRPAVRVYETRFGQKTFIVDRWHRLPWYRVRLWQVVGVAALVVLVAVIVFLALAANDPGGIGPEANLR